MSRFHPEVHRLLSEAGWYPGRDVGAEVDRWAGLASPSGFTLSEPARTVLREFGGLHVGRDVNFSVGITAARSDITFDPDRVAGEEDRFGYFLSLTERAVFPLGDASGHHLFWAIDDRGMALVLMDELYADGLPFEEVMARLLLGLRLAT